MTTFRPHRILRKATSPRLYPTEKAIFLEEAKPVSQSLEWSLAAR